MEADTLADTFSIASSRENYILSPDSLGKHPDQEQLKAYIQAVFAKAKSRQPDTFDVSDILDSKTPHNECIARVKSYLVAHPELTPPYLKTAFNTLEKESEVPNAMDAYLRGLFANGEGLTPRQFSVAFSYILHRAMPTLDEISACVTAMNMAGYYDHARGVFKNLKDEMNGRNYHIKLMFDGMERFSQRMNEIAPGSFICPTESSYRLQRTEILPLKAIRAWAKQSSSEIDAEARANLLKNSTLEAVFDQLKGEQPAEERAEFVENWKEAQLLAKDIPDTSHYYAQAIHELIREGITDPGTARLCAMALCLGRRESGSARWAPEQQRDEEDLGQGIVAFFSTLIHGYKGYFTQDEFRHSAKGKAGINAYAAVHLDVKDGVEDAHKAQANSMALEFVKRLLEYEKRPDLQAKVFLNEAKLIGVGNQLAQDFKVAMERARALDLAEGKAPIPINSKDFLPEQQPVQTETTAAQTMTTPEQTTPVPEQPVKTVNDAESPGRVVAAPRSKKRG